MGKKAAFPRGRGSCFPPRERERFSTCSEKIPAETIKTSEITKRKTRFIKDVKKHGRPHFPFSVPESESVVLHSKTDLRSVYG